MYKVKTMEPSEYPDSPFREMFQKWEKRLDDLFDRISGNLHDMPAGSTSVSGEISDDTPLSHQYLRPQSKGENIPLAHEGPDYISKGESFHYQCPSPDIQYEAVQQVTSETSSGSTLFACEIPPPNNGQIDFDVSGVSESHCAPVLDKPRVTQCPVSQTLASEDPNLHSSMFSPSNVRREIEAQDDNSVTCLSVQSLAHNSDVTARNNESFFVTGPSPGDDRKHPMTALPPSVQRHGTRLGPGPLINTGTDSEIVALSFPRHGPDQGKPRFVGIMEQDSSGLTSALGLAFPKLGPDHSTAFFRQLAPLQFVAQYRLPMLPVSHAFVVRLAQGREAYGRLRPVRRPWLC